MRLPNAGVTESGHVFIYGTSHSCRVPECRARMDNADVDILGEAEYVWEKAYRALDISGINGDGLESETLLEALLKIEVKWQTQGDGRNG